MRVAEHLARLEREERCI